MSSSSSSGWGRRSQWRRGPEPLLPDPMRFRQVVQNLVSNAVEHGGPEVAVFADLAGPVYQCTVADDGPGLPVEVESQLFASSTASDEDARSER